MRGLPNGRPEAFPARTARKTTPHYDVQTAIVVNAAGSLLMGQRPRDGLLGGLWEFVSGDFRGTADESLADMVFRRSGARVAVAPSAGHCEARLHTL